VSPLSDELLIKRDRLLAVLRGMHRVVVALSGGVDSAVVAKAAHLALGHLAIAVTADSPSVARRDLGDAKRIAFQIGIAHRIISTDEFASADYSRNDGSRCYYCKDELYDRLVAHYLGTVVSGANVDDAGDYRPGLTAAAEHGVRHPLQEAGLTKADVRILARHWELDVWDKPASPCLSSRIAPGVQATPERTARIEAAEALLHEMGLHECRVRLHEGELARIEVPLNDVTGIAAAHETIEKEFKELGFRYVTLDLGGFRTGSLNEMVELETRRKFTTETKS
jgi:uncharacterized protein